MDLIRQHFLYFFWLPQKHGSFRPILAPFIKFRCTYTKRGRRGGLEPPIACLDQQFDKKDINANSRWAHPLPH